MSETPKEIDTWLVDYPTCPTCGQTIEDWADIFQGGSTHFAEIECDCGVTYECTPEYSASFTSELKKPKQ